MDRQDRAMAETALTNRQRPIIGVTGPRRRGWRAWTFTRYALAQAGARPVRIRPGGSLPPEHLDGLVIGGGDDIDPDRYGGISPKVSIRIDRERDELEWRMLERAGQDDLPVLGICRGAQLINVFHGGNLHQDLLDVFENLVLRRTVLPRKSIDIEPHTRLARIMGEVQVRINSLHHQAVDRLAGDFRVSARDSDGIIQAIEATGQRFVLGVQWHPEYLPQSRTHQRIFAALVEAARQGMVEARTQEA